MRSRRTSSGGPPRVLNDTIANEVGVVDLLPTPQAHDAAGAKTPEQIEAMKARGRAAGHVPGVSNLNEVVLLLPAPTANVSGRTAEQHMAMRASIGRKTPSQLEAAVQLLPTPSSGNFNDGETLESWEARRQRNLAKGINGNGQGTPLGIAVQLDWGKYEAAVRRWEDVFGYPAPCPVEQGPSGKNRLSPIFVEWMMGLPSGWVTGIPGLTRARQLRLLGNGVVPQQAALALRLLLPRVSALPPLPRVAGRSCGFRAGLAD